jgi:hypothetical protein
LRTRNQHPSVLRAMLYSGPFVEGWAVYTERLMLDSGFRANDPLMRLIQLKWYLRAVTNAIMDSAIHVDGMTREQAMKLMTETGFQEEREAAGKWVRAQLSSTQLSTYFVGYQEHRDMRAAVEAQDGSKFNLRTVSRRRAVVRLATGALRKRVAARPADPLNTSTGVSVAARPVSRRSPRRSRSAAPWAEDDSVFLVGLRTRATNAAVRALTLRNQRRAHAYSTPRIASPSGITTSAGPGSTIIATPIASTVPPTTEIAMRRAQR